MRLVCFMLYTDVLNVSMRFSIRFCTYEHIHNSFLKRVSKVSFSGMTGILNLFVYFQVVPNALGPISSRTASENHVK